MHTKQIRGVIISEDSFRATNRKKPVRNKDYIRSRTYNAYILPGFGAWMGNVSDPPNIHSPHYSEFAEAGYELVVGPASNSWCEHGIYCKNYQELYQSKLDAVDRLIKKDISPNSKRKAVEQLLKRQHITTSDALDQKLREVLSAMDFLGTKQEVRKRTENFSAEQIAEKPRVYKRAIKNR